MTNMGNPQKPAKVFQVLLYQADSNSYQDPIKIGTVLLSVKIIMYIFLARVQDISKKNHHFLLTSMEAASAEPPDTPMPLLYKNVETNRL